MRPPFRGSPPSQVDDHAAGALDDRDQRQDVEILQPGLDHEVDLAEREQAIIVAVAAEASQADGALDRVEARPLLLGLEQIGALRRGAAPR